MAGKIVKYFLLTFLVGVCTLSCTKDSHTEEKQNGSAIRFVTATQDKTTKAELIDNSNFVDKGKGVNEDGGFTLDAWHVESEQSTEAIKYINNAWIWYFEDAIKENLGANRIWRFREKTGNKQLIEYYWPQDGALNFFAYMPMVENLSSSGVSNISYSVAEGPKFTASLPLVHNSESGAGTSQANTLTQNNMSEFIYAYTEGATPVNKQADAGDGTYGVDLKFVHPYSAILLKLKRGFRMKLHSISFNNIFYSGTYTHNVTGNTTIPSIGNWKLTEKGNLVLNIEQSIPDDINYGVTFNGPNLVLPQIIGDEAKIEIKYTRAQNSNLETHVVALKNEDVQQWEPGKAYTYVFDLGDNAEEVLFKVIVEPWKKIDYKNQIDVE